MILKSESTLKEGGKRDLREVFSRSHQFRDLLKLDIFLNFTHKSLGDVVLTRRKELRSTFSSIELLAVVVDVRHSSFFSSLFSSPLVFTTDIFILCLGLEVISEFVCL